MSQIVYIKADNQAKIACSCGRTKTIDLSQFERRITEAKVKCICGKICSVKFEYRRHYRKSVDLIGFIILSNNKRFDVHIIDISMSGIRIAFIRKANVLIDHSTADINVGDYGQIIFWLDDVNKSKIDRTVIIRRIENNELGAEFCDNIMDKKLGFYLMP